MRKVFEYGVVNFYNGKPAITADFVDEVLEFFKEDQDPEIRAGLFSLRRAATDGEIMLTRRIQPVLVSHHQPYSSIFDEDFAKFVLNIFGGGHTPAIRGRMLHLEQIAKLKL